MAQTSIARNNLNPYAEPFVPPKYYLVINPQIENGHYTPAYYYSFPPSFNLMAPQIIYPSPLPPVYQQMTQYQTPSPPQYYVPAQQIDQYYHYNTYANTNGNGYDNGNFMNRDRSYNEHHSRGRYQNGRGNTRNHRCDQHDCHYPRHYNNHRNYSNENWNGYNSNGNGNHYKHHRQNCNVQYVDSYNGYNHSNDTYYQNHQHQELINLNTALSLGDCFGELDVDEIEASVSD